MLADKLCAKNVLRTVEKKLQNCDELMEEGTTFFPEKSHLGMNHCILECETLFSQAVNYTSTVLLPQSTGIQPAATAANKSSMDLLLILFIQQKVETC